MQVHSLSLGPLGTNCYILEREGRALIIDPGAEGWRVKNAIDDLGLEPVAILLTHAHFDHIGAVDELRSIYKVSLYLHEEEHSWLEDPSLNGSQHFGNGIRIEKVDEPLEEGLLQMGPFSFQVLHTPGHSPGSVSFLFENSNVLIAGDTLFERSIGRTDLAFGNYDQLISSIQSKFFPLSDDIVVYPGHGRKTTIGEEKRENPFLS